MRNDTVGIRQGDWEEAQPWKTKRWWAETNGMLTRGMRNAGYSVYGMAERINGETANAITLRGQANEG